MFTYILNGLGSLAILILAFSQAFVVAEPNIPRIMVLCTLSIWVRLGNCEK